MMVIKMVIAALAGLVACNVQAQNGAVQHDKWKGFDRTNFSVDGHNAYYVQPSAPLTGRPWVWRASFPNWHTDIDSILLSKGFYIGYVSVDNEYGSPRAMQVWDDAWTYFTDSAGLARSVALEAVSRGALYAFAWAKRNPDKVSCIYSETPVCDFKSWPGGKGKGLGDSACWRQLKEVYHFSEAEAMAYADNPVDHLEGLAAFKVPLINVISLKDQVAPPAENALLLGDRYLALGGPVMEYPVTEGPQELYGHHFPIARPEYFAQWIACNDWPAKTRLAYTGYLSLRGGLNNFYNACLVRRKATVAFLGGSITHNPGWRDKTCAWLRERYPATEFRFIAAGIPSLGSLPHVFRLQQDVLDSGAIDLLFVEAAVNDRVNGTDSITQVRALEGIVRHARAANPAMDIVMMAFADPGKTSDYDRGIMPTEIANQEMIATHYSLPSINLGKEVRDKIRAGEFDWKNDFKDIHPSPFGQELYFENIKSLMTKGEKEFKGEVGAYRLPAAVDGASFVHGAYVTVAAAKFDSGWKLDEHWTPRDSAHTREGFVNVAVLESDKPGATLTLVFSGTAAGMAVVSGPDAGIVEYSIDHGAWQKIDLYTQWSSWLHLPWYVLFGSGLKNKQHILQVRVSDAAAAASKGHACRIVHFLVNK